MNGKILDLAREPESVCFFGPTVTDPTTAPVEKFCHKSLLPLGAPVVLGKPLRLPFKHFYLEQDLDDQFTHQLAFTQFVDFSSPF